jgi:flavin-dependent dehydrogenase
VVAKEAEYPLEGERSLVRSDTPELFFSRDLEGYGWCVRKGSYLNVGLGRRAASGFPDYLAAFTRFLEESGKAPGASRARWRGHAYLAAGAGSRTLVGDGVLLIGDAAGLAWPASGEGICPAIESAVQAAGVLIAAGGRAAADDLRPYEARARAAHPDTRPAHGVRAEATRAIGRALMRSRAFTRHVLLDRWFLRRDEGDSGVDCTDRPSTDSADHTD